MTAIPVARGLIPTETGAPSQRCLPPPQARRRAAIALLAGMAVGLGGAPRLAFAIDVNLVGLFPGKALVSVNGSVPRVMAVGTVIDGIRLIATERDHAVFEIGGRRETIALGQFYAGPANAGRKSVTLTADGRGHFEVQGSINGGTINFLVDTGATLLVLSATDATRLGLPWRQGTRQIAYTANGAVVFYRMTLDTVRVGDLVVNQVEAGVQETGMPTGLALLGMSFLNRMEMQRNGSTMVLTQRF